MIMKEEEKGSRLADCCRQRQSKSVEQNGRERPKGAYGNRSGQVQGTCASVYGQLCVQAIIKAMSI